MFAYIIIQAIISTFLGIMWSSNSWLNVFIMTALIANAVFSVYMIFEQKFGGAILANGMKLM